MIPKRRRRGVSLVEVMVVVAILMVLMTVLTMGVHRSWKQFQVNATVLTMGKVEGELMVWEMRHGERPASRDGLEQVYGSDPVPADAWGTELIYEPPSPESDLVSWGDDRAPGGAGYGADLRYSEQR